MCSAKLIILNAFFTQARTDVQPQESMDKLADMFTNELTDHYVTRALKTGSLHSADLDSMTLGKPGHVVISSQNSLMPRPSSPLAPSWTEAHRISPTAQVLCTFGPGGMVVNKRCKQTITCAENDGMLRTWRSTFTKMVEERGLRAIERQEVLELMQEKDAVLLDVLLEEEFKENSVEGAVNVPMFREIQGTSISDTLKRAITGICGVKGTERNPDFEAQVLEKYPKDKPIIIVCKRGGKVYMPQFPPDYPDTEKFKQFVDTDRYTTSCKAAALLYDAGYTNLYVLAGGREQWIFDGHPTGPAGVPAT